MPSQYYGEFGDEFDKQVKEQDRQFALVSNLEDASFLTGVGVVCAAVSRPMYHLAANAPNDSLAQIAYGGTAAGFATLALGFGLNAPVALYHGARYALNRFRR